MPFEVAGLVEDHDEYILTKCSAHCQRATPDGDDCAANAFGAPRPQCSCESGVGRDGDREKRYVLASLRSKTVMQLQVGRARCKPS